MPTADSSHYADELGRANPAEAARLRALADALDPETVRRLEEAGPAPDARVLEVGAGTGTVAAWLADRCPRGHITATDLDLSHLPAELPEHVHTLRHDIVEDPFPEGSFDLIHARCVLMHLPQRERVVERMRGWLAPGGTLLLEEIVHFPAALMPVGDPVRHSVEACCDLLASSYGMEAEWGLQATAALHRNGYQDIAAEMTLPAFRSDAAMTDWWIRTVTALGPRLRETGRMSQAEIDAALAALGEPEHLSFPLGVLAVRARVPLSGSGSGSGRP
ncbi:class I SAM-dependent methyltransferase [Streptomyces venezuelae]|uniref:class I SAM-dependent methyltransferase n=1 Tax=Streptomyces venezuelae TaxID=54571 RepID=UPI001680D02F|nr:class I SAM-dependent methyltransferase [Streptomyces venezuelae]